jgi:cbb3-type cytochrome oxidase maturation protein
MKIIIFLIIISLIVAVGFLFAFFWAVRHGQYEDSHTPSMRILLEDDMLLAKNNKTKKEKTH